MIRRWSIRARLLASAAIAIVLALAIAGFAIGQVLERFVMQGLDQRLDAELTMLASTVRADGGVDRARLDRVRTLLAPEPGWAWRIDGPAGPIAMGDGDLDQAAPPPGPPPPPPAGGLAAGPAEPSVLSGATPTPYDLDAKDGQRLHARRLTLPEHGGAVTLIAAAPREVIVRPIRAALAPLAISLALLGLALLAATLVQLRIGLAPLADLRRAIAAVRLRRADRVPDDQPAELRPLAAELNALLAANETALATARASAANLAHGLKTPLAALHLAVAEPGGDPDGRLEPLIARLDATVRHHLGRARGAAASVHAATRLEPALADLIATLTQIHAERGVTVQVAVPADIVVAIDRHDLDELAGNLLDNAWRHASREVLVRAERREDTAIITIADDGVGIPPAARTAAAEPGIRLDEGGDGHGFGLAIAQEIVQLYGGALMLGEAAGGGLQVDVTLPALPDETGR